MRRNIVCVVGLVFLCSIFLFGCGNDSEPKADSDKVETEDDLKNVTFTADTSIAYSAGSDSDWSYGNQRKEFPDNGACYVRIASKVITNKGKGLNEGVNVTYRFTGTDKCKVTISDGIVDSVDSEDKNVEEFTRTIYPQKEKKAKDDIVIFRYEPGGSDGIVLEVVYDDHVDERYDVRNTIYFSSNGDTTVQEVEAEQQQEDNDTEEEPADGKNEKGIN